MKTIRFVIALLGCQMAPIGILQASDFAVQGSYAVHAVIGPNLGSSIGIFNIDGAGTLTGHAVLNVPSADGKNRMTIPVTVSGKVTVNPDGTGQAKYGAQLPDGTVMPVTEDFVITTVKRRRGASIATTIFDQRQEASSLLGNGYEVVVTWSRLAGSGD